LNSEVGGRANVSVETVRHISQSKSCCSHALERPLKLKFVHTPLKNPSVNSKPTVSKIVITLTLTLEPLTLTVTLKLKDFELKTEMDLEL